MAAVVEVAAGNALTGPPGPGSKIDFSDHGIWCDSDHPSCNHPQQMGKNSLATFDIDYANF